MKKIILILIIVLISQNGYMSGSRKEVLMQERCSRNYNIFEIKITNNVQGVVQEIDEVNKSVSSFHGYSAVIIKVINRSNQSPLSEDFHIKFSSSETTLLKKIKKNGISNLEVNDPVIIMDSENIRYTIIYEVRGLHKIFFYHYSADAVDSVKTGETYILIADNIFSNENGVLYGNVGYGLYPDSPKIREKIDAILNSDKTF